MNTAASPCEPEPRQECVDPLPGVAWFDDGMCAMTAALPAGWNPAIPGPKETAVQVPADAPAR